MKLLVVCQYYYPEPFRVTDICETLAAEGHDVTVLTGLPNYPEGRVPAAYRHGKKRDETVNGVHILRCFEVGRGKSVVTRFLNYFSYPLSASMKVHTLGADFDAVLVNQLSPVMMARPALKYKQRHGAPVLLYCLDLWPASVAAGGISERSPIYRCFLGISRRIYRAADGIAATSMMFRQYFKDVIGLDAARIAYLPQYAEDVFQPAPPADKADGWNFVFAGNIGEAQAVETVIRAANELKDAAGVRFHIVGEGSALAGCRALAAEYGLDNVTFYGRRPLSDMPQYYAMADAMLVTMCRDEALSYTLPGKVQSYMAAGKPIVGACGGETARVLGEAGCGWCGAAEDYLALADNLRRLMADRAALKRFSEASAAYYRQHFTKEAFMAGLTGLLKDTMLRKNGSERI